MKWVKTQMTFVFKNPMEAGITVAMWIVGASIGMFFILLAVDLFKHVAFGSEMYFENQPVESGQ